MQETVAIQVVDGVLEETRLGMEVYIPHIYTYLTHTQTFSI